MDQPAALSRLLLATEWTPFDAGAEAAALDLARRLRRPLDVIVPLLANPEYEVVEPARIAASEEEAARGAQAFRARAEAAGVAAQVRIRRGDEPWREIVEEARSQSADLLVVRRRGRRSFLGNLRIGEMVRRVAMHAPCPTLMVPRAARAPTQRVLCVCEAATDAARVAPVAAALAAALALPLSVLVDAHEDATAGARLLQCAYEQAAACGVSARGELLAADLVTRVLARASELGADLLVLGLARDRSAFGRFSRTGESLVAQAACASCLVGEPMVQP